MNESSNQPAVSVIILNYNGVSLLERCLSSVLNSDYQNFEILFVDNASTDESVDFAKKKFGNDARLRMIQCQENFGFAKGNNIGVKHAKGKYLIFLNTDTEVSPAWLSELVTIMENDSTLGAAQSRLMRLDSPQLFDSVGDIMDYYGGAFSMGHGEKDDGQYNIITEIFSAKGAAFIVKRSIFENVGMFDSKFVSFLEDVDLCWRIWLNGYRIVYAPKSVVYHLGGATLKKLPKELIVSSTIRSRRNQVIMMIKNYDFKNIIRYVPIRIIINGLIILSVSIANPIDAKNTLKNPKNSLNLKDVWKQHLKIQYTVRKIPDESVMQHMLESKLAYLFSFLVNSVIYGENFATKAYFYRQKSASIKIYDAVNRGHD